MDVLDKYVLKEFLSFFVLILLGVAVLYSGTEFIYGFWKSDRSVLEFTRMELYKMPDILMQLFPMSVLLAASIVLSLMNRQQELLVIGLSGMSRWRVLASFFPVVAILSGVFFLVFDGVVPGCNRIYALLRSGKSYENISVSLNEFASGWYRSGSSLYHVGRVGTSGGTLSDLNLFEVSSGWGLTRRVWAKDGSYENSQWRLNDGFIVNRDEGGFPVRSEFESLAGVSIEPPAEFAGVQTVDNEMRLKDLRAYIRKGSAYGFDATESTVTFHDRIASAFSPLVFVMIAVAFLSQLQLKVAVSQGVGLSFIVVLLYVLLSKFTVSLGKGGFVPPLVAAWLPNALLIFVAGAKLRRVG